MTNFKKYLDNLAKHESKNNEFFLNSRQRIIVNAGIRLNSIGDLMGNPKIKFHFIKIPIGKVLFSRTNPKWNKILIDKCERSVENFKTLIKKDATVKKRFSEEASYGIEPILMFGPDTNDYYTPFDGMHRVIGAILKNRKTISAFITPNETKHLPYCESHIIYDLIRAYQRRARDKQGKTELYHALKLLARTYGNVIKLLKIRFNYTWVPDKDVQDIIKKVIKNTKRSY